MPLTLEQYVDYLDTRQDLNWPAPPAIEPPKAKPHLPALEGIKAVTWSVYGTLLNIAGGELYFEHPQEFVMEVALEKTIQEFKMWQSMSRKPGKPSEYMGKIYEGFLTERRMATTGGERYPEIAAEEIWEAVLKRLLKNEYVFDATFFGSLDEYSRKIAYFFHASLQGTECYPGASVALEHVSQTAGCQALVADGQCFTAVQVARGLRRQGGKPLEQLIPTELRVLSHDLRAKKPSPKLFETMLERLVPKGIKPGQVLHIGSSVVHDVAPAKSLGMRTALFAGDKASLRVTPEEWKQPNLRPDVLLTELDQITQVLG